MILDPRWAPWKQQFSFNTSQSGNISDWASSSVTNPFTASYGHTRIICARGFVFLFNISTPGTCYRAEVTSGSLGSWTEISTSIDGDIFASMDFLFAGDRLYRLGGVDFSSGHIETTAAVYWAPISEAGAIGSWTASSSLPAGRRFGCVVLVGTRVYYLGGQQIRYLVEFSSFVEDSKSTVYYADLDTNGDLGTWSTSGNSLPDLRARSGAAIAGNTIYLVGGEKGGNKQDTVFKATISGTSIGAWSTSGYTLGEVKSDVQTCVTHGTIYVFGGTGSASYVFDKVAYNGLDSSGELTGAWSNGTVLPGGDGLTFFDVLVTSSKIYLLGGYGNSGLESNAIEATFAGGADDYILLPEDIGLTPSLYTASQTFYGPTMSPGAVSLTPSLLTLSQTIYAPEVALGDFSLLSNAYTNQQTFYGPTLALRLTPTLFTQSQTFYGPTAAPGAVSLSPALFTDAQTFYGPTATPGSFSLQAALFTDSQTFYSPIVTPWAVTIDPELVTNEPEFFAPSFDMGEISIETSLHTNTSSVIAPVVAAGGVDLSPELVLGGQTFFGPSLLVGDVTLTATMRVTNSNSFYGPIITIGDLSLTFSLFSNEQEVFAPTVGVSDTDLLVPFLDSETAFFSAELYIGDLQASPPLILSESEVFAPVVTIGELTAFAPLFINQGTIYIPSVALVGTPLPEFVSGELSENIWGTSLDQGWGGVVIDEGYLNAVVDQQLWGGEQGAETWSTEIDHGWSGIVLN